MNPIQKNEQVSAPRSNLFIIIGLDWMKFNKVSMLQ